MTLMFQDLKYLICVFCQDAISKWPPLRPLCLILKVFLQQRELNEVPVDYVLLKKCYSNSLAFDHRLIHLLLEVCRFIPGV